MPINDGNGFTNKEMLISLDKKIEEGFKNVKEQIANGHNDHETRLRTLEDLKGRAIGICIFLSLAVPALVTLSVYNKI